MQWISNVLNAKWYYIPLLQSRSKVLHAHSDVVIEPLKNVLFNFTNWRHILNFDSIPLMEHFCELGREAVRQQLPLIDSLRYVGE